MACDGATTLNRAKRQQLTEIMVMYIFKKIIHLSYHDIAMYEDITAEVVRVRSRLNGLVEICPCCGTFQILLLVSYKTTVENLREAT